MAGEAREELSCGQLHHPGAIAVGTVAAGEADVVRIHLTHALIGNGGLFGVAGQVVQGLLGASQRSLARVWHFGQWRLRQEW